MKGIIVDIDNMSDSKEVYSQRPSRLLSGFVYAILGLLVAALLYSLVGTIEIVSTGNGFIRPNDKVGTVSGTVGGQIADVHYTDGVAVNEGDILLVLDYTDLQTDLTNLEAGRDQRQREITLLQKYLDSINQEANLFSSDPAGEEYDYFVKYSLYEVSVRDKELNSDYEAERDRLSLLRLEKEVARQNNDILGLSQLHSSITSGEDLVGNYPRYQYQYLVHQATLQSIEQDYQKERSALLQDSAGDVRERTIAFYDKQVQGYETLLQSIREGEDRFSPGDDGMYQKMYEAYAYSLEDQERNYESAKLKVGFLEEGNGSATYKDSSLEYHSAMLEGYRLFRQSVSQERDAFQQDKPSYHYRSLYSDYLEGARQAKLDFEQKKALYEQLVRGESAHLDTGDTGDTEGEEGAVPAPPTAQEIAAAKSNMDAADTMLQEYKRKTLAEIDSRLLEIEATIAEVNMNTGSTSREYDLSVAKREMETAENGRDALRAKNIQEIEAALQDLELKREELVLTQDRALDENFLLEQLRESYTQAANERYWTTLQQTEESLEALQLERDANKAELEQLENTLRYYDANKTAQDEKIPVAYLRLGELQTSLDTLKTLEQELREVNYSIAKTKLDIEAATIKAARSGVINSTVDISRGDVLQPGDLLATIIPPEESQFRVQIYLDNKDIAGIKPGDPVKYNIAALPKNQYGTLQGTVVNISKDTRTQGDSSGYYLVEATLDNQMLRDKDGNEGEITVGMSLDAKIVTQKKRIITYLLEKMNLS